MLKTWNVCAVLAVAAVLLVGSQTSEARPQYLKGFKDQYPEVSKAKTATCFVCHGKTDGKMDKEKRNAYGSELGKELGAKNVKSVDDIKSALTKCEDGKCEDGTFGDRLKAGKWPVDEEK